MKIIVISLLCLSLIGISSYSYAQYTEPDSDTKVPVVMLQLVIRDSDGNLVAYVEGVQIMAIYPLEFNEFLDKQHKEFLIKDDKAYEIIQWQGKTEKFTKKYTYSSFNLWANDQGKFKKVLMVRHDSYQTQPGDTVSVYWTIIRPAN